MLYRGKRKSYLTQSLIKTPTTFGTFAVYIVSNIESEEFWSLKSDTGTGDWRSQGDADLFKWQAYFRIKIVLGVICRQVSQICMLFFGVVKSIHLLGKIWHTREDDNRIVLRDLVASFFLLLLRVFNPSNNINLCPKFWCYSLTKFKEFKLFEDQVYLIFSVWVGASEGCYSYLKDAGSWALAECCSCQLRAGQRKPHRTPLASITHSNSLP